MWRSGRAAGCWVVMDAPGIPYRLPWQQKLFYSFGHIQNDLCATMWFTLLLVFFQFVVGIREKVAGYLLMWGQVVDAICTPLIGYESDRIRGCCGLPKRKSWHLLGAFATCLCCMDLSCIVIYAYNTALPSAILSVCHRLYCGKNI